MDLFVEGIRQIEPFAVTALGPSFSIATVVTTLLVSVNLHATLALVVHK